MAFSGRIEQQKSVHGALHQHARILLDQLLFPVVAGGEVEIVGRSELLDDAAHDAGEVALAEVGSEHADAHGLALAQGAGEVIGAVVEALRRPP